MSYVPKPIPIEQIALPPELTDLIERLAEHVHDTWSRQRFADGWRFGPKRNDAKKQHPCLVPYADLPDSEKEYDRRIATGTIKAILALGYQIVKE